MNSPQVGQIKTIKGKQYRLNRAHRWERLPEPDHGHNSPVARALHTADHLGESVVSWKVGKLLGGPIGAIASAAGYDAVQSKIIAETAVQAAAATAIHAIKEQRSGTLRPVELGAYFLTQSSAAFLGKQAHHGVEEMAEAMHLQEVAHFMAPLLAGKITGISTVAAANKTGIYQKAFDMVVEKGKHDVTLLAKFFGGFGKSADDSAIAQLLFDLTEAAIAIAVLSSQGLKKSGGAVYYSINSEVYEPRRDRLHGVALFKIAHGTLRTDEKGATWYFNGPTKRWRRQKTKEDKGKRSPKLSLETIAAGAGDIRTLGGIPFIHDGDRWQEMKDGESVQVGNETHVYQDGRLRSQSEHDEANKKRSPSKPKEAKPTTDAIAEQQRDPDKTPWLYSASQYLSAKGIKEPWLAEISPMQLGNMSKRERAEYMQQRSREWQASGDAKMEWARKVWSAYKSGEFSESDLPLEERGRRDTTHKLLSSMRIEEDKQSRSAAIRVAESLNEIRSPDSLTPGDRIFDAGSGEYVTVIKPFKQSVRVIGQDGGEYKLDIGYRTKWHSGKDLAQIALHGDWLAPEKPVANEPEPLKTKSAPKSKAKTSVRTISKSDLWGSAGSVSDKDDGDTGLRLQASETMKDLGYRGVTIDKLYALKAAIASKENPEAYEIIKVKDGTRTEYTAIKRSL